MSCRILEDSAGEMVLVCRSDKWCRRGGGGVEFDNLTAEFRTGCTRLGVTNQLEIGELEQEILEGMQDDY